MQETKETETQLQGCQCLFYFGEGSRTVHHRFKILQVLKTTNSNTLHVQR